MYPCYKEKSVWEALRRIPSKKADVSCKEPLLFPRRSNRGSPVAMAALRSAAAATRAASLAAAALAAVLRRDRVVRMPRLNENSFGPMG